MADVKWIKITTDMFNDEKILLIESLPEADSIIVIWCKLLCLAGKMNNSGVFMMNDKIAYTDKMLATIFRRKEATVTMALNTFENFGMIEIVDGVITIPNWGKHQSLDQLENKKEYMRNYMKEYREKQKLLTCKTNSKTSCKTNSKANVRQADKEEEIDKEIDKDIDIKKQKYGEYQHVLLTSDEFNNLSNDFGKELIDKAVKFLDEYIEEKGYESNSHCLTIRRWVIKAVKEQEQKHNKTHNSKPNQFNNFTQRKYTTEEMDALERKMLGLDQKEVEPLTEEELKEAEDLKQELKEKYGKGSS